MPLKSLRIFTSKSIQAMAVLGFTLCLLPAMSAQAKTQLAASPFETYVSDNGEPSRTTDIAADAFRRAGIDVELKIMRDAFLGSAVLTGKVDGEFAFIDLGKDKDDFLLSDIYLPIYLYALGKTSNVQNVQRFSHLKDNRVAIENRFANTPNFRLLKELKWSRNPSSFDAFKQLADDRAPYLVTTALLATEFNKLLLNDNEELLHFSASPLATTGFQIALRKNVSNAKQIIDSFNAAIVDMQRQGVMNQHLALEWLTKDIDGDGTADFIGHSSITHKSSELTGAYSLDGVPTSDESHYYIDGKKFTSIKAAQEALKQQPTINRQLSLLDATTYKQLIQRW